MLVPQLGFVDPYADAYSAAEHWRVSKGEHIMSEY